MSQFIERCLVSGNEGHLVASPAGRLLLSATAINLDAGDVDRIIDDVGLDVALRSAAGLGGSAALLVDGGDTGTRLSIIGDVGVLVSRRTVTWFARPAAGVVHTFDVPDDADSIAIGLRATAPSDLEIGTAMGVTGVQQAATRLVVGLGEAADLEATPPEGVRIETPGETVPESDATGPEAPSGDPSLPPPSVPGLQVVDLTIQSSTPLRPLPVSTLPPPSTVDDRVQVLGIRCPVDHHNHPDAEYCSTCGRKMGVNATANLVQGPRPPVGLFIADDGTAIPLAGDLLLGREPLTHPDVVSGRRLPVLLADDTNVISRHHVAVTLNGWDVEVMDLGSANGASLTNSTTRLSARLVPDRSTPIAAGDELVVGPRTLRLSLHHIA